LFIGEPRNTHLTEVQIPITNTTECKQLYKKNNTVIDDTMICAGHPNGGKDACRVIYPFNRIICKWNINDLNYLFPIGFRVTPADL